MSEDVSAKAWQSMFAYCVYQCQQVSCNADCTVAQLVLTTHEVQCVAALWFGAGYYENLQGWHSTTQNIVHQINEACPMQSMSVA